MKHVLLILGVMLIVSWGCDGISMIPVEGSTTPSGQTGDDSETTTMIIPESVSLDIDELDEVGGESAQIVPPSHPLETAQVAGQQTMAQLDEIMTRFSYINTLVTSASDIQITNTIVWNTAVPGSVPTSTGSRVANPGSGSGSTRDIKVDFSAFDFDGDGVDEGSGTPTTAPVALRVWVTDASGTYQPAACGVINVLPTSTHAGAGEMITLSYARNTDGDIAIIEWDEDDPTDQSLMTWDEHPEGSSWGYSSFVVEHEQVGSDMEKTVCSTINESYVAARWYEGTPAAAYMSFDGPWVDAVASPPSANYAFFVSLGSATAADADSVDVSDLELEEPPDSSWFAWPGDFPTTPTF